jgi:UDPglucose--hexose-1-phosphate uridylyltransferase
MFDSPDHPHRRGKPPTVQVFENKGAMMGRSNPHPHGQARADGFVPNEAATEDPRRRDCLAAHARPPLLDCAEVESGGTRPVVESDQWIAPVPCGAARCLRAVGPVHHNQR